jgi:hypothetical protein
MYNWNAAEEKNALKEERRRKEREKNGSCSLLKSQQIYKHSQKPNSPSN